AGGGGTERGGGGDKAWAHPLWWGRARHDGDGCGRYAIHRNLDADFTAADPLRCGAPDREWKPQPRSTAARSAHGRGTRLSWLRSDPVDRFADHRRDTQAHP